MSGNGGMGDKGAALVVKTVMESATSAVTTIDLSFNGLTKAFNDSISSYKHQTDRTIEITMFGNDVDDFIKLEKKEEKEEEGNNSQSPKNVDPIYAELQANKAKKKVSSSIASTGSIDKRRSSKKISSREKGLLQREKSVDKTEKNDKFEIISLETDPEKKAVLLEEFLDELQSKEREYLSMIAQLESKVLEHNAALPKKEGSRKNSIAKIIPMMRGKGQRNKSVIDLGKPIRMGKISHGNHVNVYSVLVDGWICAMKEIDTSELSKEEIDRFIHEIRILELLPRHQNIVTYLFHEIYEDKIRLFMTRYSLSLYDRIQLQRQEKKLFTPKQICFIAIEVIKGIEVLHQHCILHRDIKSDNIFVLLNERKEINIVSIGDFDTAKQIKSRSQKAVTVIGTPSWMAPEVINSSIVGEYSFPCDIYSFGMVLYELLTLKIPYEDLSPPQIPLYITQGKKPMMKEYGAEYDKLIHLYEDCIDYEPTRRPKIPDIKQNLVNILAQL